MATKVEILGYGLGGPYEIFLNGTRIDDVEDIQLTNDGKIHRVQLTLFVKEFQLRPIKDEQKQPGKVERVINFLKDASMSRKKDAA